MHIEIKESRLNNAHVGSGREIRHLSYTLKNSSEENVGKSKQSNDSKGAQANNRSLASFEDGLYVQAVMEAIRVSSREKSWSKVNVADEAKET